MFQYAWQPFFLNNAKEKDAKEVFAKIMTLFVLAASLLWIVITLFIENLARLDIGHGRTLIENHFLPGLVVVPIILLAYLFNGIYVNLWAGLYIEEKTKYFPYVTGAGALVNVAVNIALIPVLGIVGAALATLASYMVMASAIFIFAQRFYKIDYEYGKLLKILGTIFVAAILYYYGYYHGGLTIAYKGLLLLGFVASLLVLRVVEKMEITRLVKILLRRRS
jgi:O-antigen/teichoic acid export membrane protein